MTTARRKKAVTFEETKGEAAVMEVQLPEVYIDTGSMISQRAWHKLNNDSQKKAALDAFFNRMDQVFSRNWQATYELISLARGYERYWRDQGFDSFEEFWRERGRFAFDQFRKLESIYNYAKQACPGLFDADYAAVKSLIEKLAKVGGVAAGGTNGRAKSPSTKSSVSAAEKLLETLEPEKQSSEWQAGFRAGRGHSAAYRFGRLRRDAPRVAADVLAGKYIRFRKSGKPYLNLSQAERDAGILSEKPKVPRTKAYRAAESVERLGGIKELREFVDQLPTVVRSKLKRVLKVC